MGRVTLPSHHPQRMNRSGPDDEPAASDLSDFSALQCFVGGESHLSQVMPVGVVAVRLVPTAQL
jgi:hypothetical protein